MIVWVSRNWLTRGLEAVEVEEWRGWMRTVAIIPGSTMADSRLYFGRGEYALTEDAARKQALRKARLQVKKLKAEIVAIERRIEELR